MRARAALAAGAASLLALAAPAAARAQDEKPPPPAVWTCTRPEAPALPDHPTERDMRDRALQERLRALQCELDARRHLENAQPQERCYFGPETVRIPAKRYDEIRAAYKDDPVELWHALLSEPDDPNARPIQVRVNSKSGPHCGDDRDRALEDEIDAIQKDLNFR
jgi:hypothetical protein